MNEDNNFNYKSIIGAAAFAVIAVLFRQARDAGFTGGMRPVAVALMGLVCFLVMFASLLLAFNARFATPDFGRALVKLIVSNALLAALAVSFHLLARSEKSIELAVWVVENVETWWIINGVDEIRMGVMFISVVVGARAALSVWRGRSERVVTVIHAAGIWAYLVAIRHIWGGLPEIALWPQVRMAGIIYIAAVVCVVAMVVYLKVRGGREKGMVEDSFT